MDPEIEGLRSALRSLRADIANQRMMRFRAEWEAARAHYDRAQLELVLAERASRTGIDQMPMNADAAKRYFAAMDARAGESEQ